MNQLVIDTASIFPLLWAFLAGFISGGIFFYPSGRRKGVQEALREKTREETARAFAQYINNIAQGASYGSTSAKKT
ncbi:MAG: hypothetical protein WAN11_24060 [Syntrophobacteraceae bacterium]